MAYFRVTVNGVCVKLKKQGLEGVALSIVRMGACAPQLGGGGGGGGGGGNELAEGAWKGWTGGCDYWYMYHPSPSRARITWAPLGSSLK